MTDIPKKYDLAVIEQKLTSIDVSRLAEYTQKASEISGLSVGAAAGYMKDFIVAYDVAAAALAVATKCEMDADSALKYHESVSYFEKASDYLKQKDVKDTDAARKRYVDLDEDVLMAKNMLTRASATSQLMKNKLTMFRYAYEAIKKIYFNGGNDMPYEGM